MELDKGLQNEIDDLVELGQTGVHTVTRSQAFKDTGWDPSEAYVAAEGKIVCVIDDYLGDFLIHGVDPSRIALSKSPQKELELLKDWIKGHMESEDPDFYLTESLRSTKGQECGLFTEFYSAVWNTIGRIDDCRWIVYPNLEELDLFLLREDRFRVSLDGSGPNNELLRKWNEDNREFWNKIYEFQLQKNKWVEDR